MVTMNLLTNGAATTGHFPHDHLNLMQKRVSVSVRNTRKFSGYLSLLLAGISSMILAIVMTRLSLVDLVLDERSKMSPSLPPYDMWLNPDPEVRLSVYIFTVLNAQQYLDGTDVKLRLHEVGPIVYREILHHENVVLHPENSTMSYTAVRRAEFVDHYNEPNILNRTITVPNFALLGAASMLHDSSIFIKIGFKALKYSAADSVFINITIGDYLWNYQSSLVRQAGTLLPFMVPTENTGILHTVYNNFVDRYNVRVGTANADTEFFRINTVNGLSTVPGYSLDKGDCDASVVNSTEGLVYGQRINRHTVVNYWRRCLCRTVPLFYEKDVRVGQIDAYKFTLLNNTYDRLTNSTADCWKRWRSTDVMPDGLSDLSKCFFDIPFAASNPHFYGRDTHLINHVDGLTPNERDHSSYIIMEPTLGVPIDQRANSQNNLVMPVLSGFPLDVQRFSNMTIPLFWLQYHQSHLTEDITAMLVFTVTVLPCMQLVLTALLYFIALMFLLLCFMRSMQSKRMRLINAGLASGPMEIIKTNAHHIVFEKDVLSEKPISSNYCR